MLRGALRQLRALFVARRGRVMLIVLLGAATLSVAVYREQVIRELPIAVVDRDQSGLSRTLRRFLDATRQVKVIDSAPTSVEEAKAWLIRGEIVGVVVLPRGMSADLKRGHQARVLTAVDMGNILVGKNAQAAITRVIKTVAAGARIKVMTKLGLSSDRAFAEAAPTAVEIEAPFNPSTNYAHYLAAPLMFFLLHVYTLLLACGALRREAGLWARLGALGVVLGFTFGLGMIGLLYGLPWVGIYCASDLALAAALIAGLLGASILLAAAADALAPNPFVALEVTVVMGMLSLMLSGVTWPVDRFPQALARVSEILPFTPFAQAMQILLYRPVGWGAVAPEVSHLARLAAAFGGVAIVGSALRWAWPGPRRPEEVQA